MSRGAKRSEIEVIVPKEEEAKQPEGNIFSLRYNFRRHYSGYLSNFNK